MTKNDQPWVLGLSASHNGAACLLHGDHIVAAIQEERLAGKKRARLFGSRPSLAVRYCLDVGGIAASDLDMVVLCAQTDARRPENEITQNPLLDVVTNGTPTQVISHHAGHAISAFATSGFDEAAALIIDGMGSPTSDLSADERSAIVDPGVPGGETTSIYHSAGTRLQALEKHMIEQGRWLNPPPAGAAMPTFGSLGGMFSAAAAQIFGDPTDAGKVMGLAPYGEPTIDPEEFFTIRGGRFIFSDAVPKQFTRTRRWPDDRREYENLAASVQNALEQALLYLVRHVRELNPCRNLVYAGGVALNSVANERIIREGDFDNVYIMPAAEDSGPAIGAAYHGLWQLTGRYIPWKLERDGFGKTYDAQEIASAIERTPAIIPNGASDVVTAAADLLADGKIIAWFSGPSELGPRALGQRSILCDPRRPDAKERLNARVKHREAFRPFAPIIPLEDVDDWFELDGYDPRSPFMLRIMKFREEKRDLVPAVVHVDGTGRVQTVTREANGSCYELVKAFGARTGVPIVLNTSLNVMGEPVVETPEDALWCLLLTQLDACVFDGVVVSKKPGYQSLGELYPYFLLEQNAVGRPPSGDGLQFRVSTPWGSHAIGLREQKTVAILEFLLGGAMDGNTQASDVFAGVRDKLGDIPDTELIRLFALLRRWRLISFRESPATPNATAAPASAAVASDAELGVRYLTGRGVRPDPARGVSLVERAAAAGDAEGAWLAATIASSDLWQKRDWNRALDYLARAAERGHPAAQSSLRILAGGPGGNNIDGNDWSSISGSVDFNAWLEPPERVTLREKPRIDTLLKFAPPAACDWLIGQARDRLSRATIYDKVTGGSTEDTRRTNSQCDLDVQSLGVLTFVLRARLAALVGRGERALEIPKVLHYSPGETFARHYDFLDPNEAAYAAELASRGQRTHTFLIYLNDGFEGGETEFPLIDISHKGAKGDGLLFANTDADSRPDKDTMHTGLPPESGEKWVFSQWIREFPRS